jgi:hypothetical protein
MTSAARDPAAEWQRLASVSSVVDVVAASVDGIAQLHVDEIDEWLNGLGVPDGWRIARFDSGDTQPSRIAVYGQRPRGGWDGCETITVFGFTGIPNLDDVRRNADCTLRDLDADAIITQRLVVPPGPGVVAARSSGYFSTAGQRVWAQYSAYIAGSHPSGQGRLIEHNVFVESACRARLNDDVAKLSEAVHHAFLTTLGTYNNSG